MQQHGPDVADGTIVRLYKDVRTIGSRMQNYEPDDVLGWLERMQVEVQAFRGRMASMCDAAIDAKTFERLCQKLQGQGFEMLRNDALEDQDRGLPLAWALVAAKA
jgi:hypothetical protein